MDMKEIICGSVLLYSLGAMLMIIVFAACDYRKVSFRVDDSDITAFSFLAFIWPIVVLVAGVQFTTYWLICAGRALRRIFVKDKKGDKE